MVLETGKRLAARGHRVDCICIRADRNIVGSETGITFHEIGGPLSSQLLFWLNFRSSCARVADVAKRIVEESEQKCVLFPQVFPANWWGSSVLKRMPNTVSVWYCHEPSAFIHSIHWINALPWPKNWIAKALNPILRRWDLQACKGFTRVLVNSKYSRQYTQGVYGFADNLCEVVYLGFDQQKFAPGNIEDRQSAIVCVAKLTRFKNVERVIEAMRVLETRGNTHSKLHIVGTGDALQSLQQQAVRLGVDSRVVFHGRLDDTKLVQLIQQARALCLASVEEPFGLVAIEALACGTPVIAVNSGGPAEILGASGAGVLIERPDPELIAEAMNELLDNPLEFRNKSKSAVARAADFDWERTVDRLEAVMRQELGSKTT